MLSKARWRSGLQTLHFTLPPRPKAVSWGVLRQTTHEMPIAQDELRETNPISGRPGGRLTGVGETSYGKLDLQRASEKQSQFGESFKCQVSSVKKGKTVVWAPNFTLYTSNSAEGRLYEQTQLEEFQVSSFKCKAGETDGRVLKSSYFKLYTFCLLYTSPSPRDRTRSRMPSSA